MTAALEGSEWSAARPGRTLTPGKTRYPLYMRLGGPQGRSGRAENLVPTGIRSRTVQPGSSVAIPTELPGPQLREILSHKDPVPIVQEAVQHVTVLNTAGNCNTVVLLYYIVILWDRRRICGPSLNETSLCGASLYSVRRFSSHTVNTNRASHFSVPPQPKLGPGCLVVGSF